jgi:2-polyprenyl-3-methyl-5-hydroxy-6-metoxy-1,4-benzoquinol methylase
MIQDLLDADGLTRAGYDEDRWFQFVEHVVETLDVGPGTKVWAVGCGAGSFLYPLSLNGYSVGGIDPSAEHIALARSAIPRGTFAVGSPLDFNPAEPWDVVLSGRGLSHCRDPNDVRGLLARMAAKATHAVALLRMEEADPNLNRALLLRLFTEIGVSAVQFEPAEAARVNVFARVTAGAR